MNFIVRLYSNLILNWKRELVAIKDVQGFFFAFKWAQPTISFYRKGHSIEWFQNLPHPPILPKTNKQNHFQQQFLKSLLLKHFGKKLVAVAVIFSAGMHFMTARKTTWKNSKPAEENFQHFLTCDWENATGPVANHLLLYQLLILVNSCEKFLSRVSRLGQSCGPTFNQLEHQAQKFNWIEADFVT